MRLREWIETFRFLHEKARAGKLGESEVPTYHELREDFAALLLAGQCLTVTPGQTARGSLRAVRPLPLELLLPSGSQRTATLDLSAGGFSTLVPVSPPAGGQVEFVLGLASGPLRGRARVVSAHDEGTSYRASFKFEPMGPDGTERVLTEVLDTALQQFEFFAVRT
ncbi:MAG TPA: PilZ domain-containing protein [Myxococcales bacterium]|nr:PilZ domain-containing protein [Myxococcales bacterium]